MSELEPDLTESPELPDSPDSPGWIDPLTAELARRGQELLESWERGERLDSDLSAGPRARRASRPGPVPPEDKWARHALVELRRAGHNRGASRDAMIALFAGEECARSAREIEEAVKRVKGGPVGRSSVYRGIEELHDLGLITRVDVGDGIVRYEAVRLDEEHHHHHMLCERCGLLIPFDDAELERTLLAVAQRYAFTLKDHDVTLRGVCVECRADSD